MSFVTLRCVFEMEAVLSLLKESAFEHDITLTAWRDVKPRSDHALAVFVFASEPFEGARKLELVSSTVLAIQRFTTVRLSYQNVFVVGDLEPDGVHMQALRAHFRAEQKRVTETVANLLVRVPGQRVGPSFATMFHNGGGDLEEPVVFLIRDTEAEELERWAGLSDPGAEPEPED